MAFFITTEAKEEENPISTVPKYQYTVYKGVKLQELGGRWDLKSRKISKAQ
jgi:hypothetical protein